MSTVAVLPAGKNTIDVPNAHFDDVQFEASTGGLIHTDTSDGSDTKAIVLAGGGAGSNTRGALITYHGNEHATNPGMCLIESGNAASASIRLSTPGTQNIDVYQNGSNYWRFLGSSSRPHLTFVGSVNATIGATTSDAADTASLVLLGGGGNSEDINRGAYIRVNGNEHGSNAGQVNIASGVTGQIQLQTTASGKPLILDANYTASSAGCRFALNNGSTDGLISAFSHRNGISFAISNTNGSFTGAPVATITANVTGSAFGFLSMFSNNGSDREFDFNGAGTAFADGSWTGGGADYAEYFESVSGDSIEPGTVVELVDGKVQPVTPATLVKNIIGVVRQKHSGTSFVANMPLKWPKKWLRDEYGAHVVDSEGKRQLNPDFDRTKEYITRDKRKEWCVVGLIGQVSVNNGQKTPASWLPMRRLSDNVTLYYIR